MTAPRVTITEEARQWLHARGGALTLRDSPRHGCCGGRAFVPVADPDAPADPVGCTRRRVDGVDVYLAPAIAARAAAVRVGLDGFWKWRRLVVEGVAMAGSAV